MACRTAILATSALFASALCGCSDKDVSPCVPKGAAEQIITDIKNQLKDPDSLQIDWVSYDSKKTAYCSTYNAKNSFGGYVGKHRFAAFVLPDDTGKIKKVTGVVLEDEFTAGLPATDVVCR